MSQSLSAVYIHLAYATKYRKPVLSDAFRPDLHAFKAGVLKSTGCNVLIINSVEDHIHLLFRMTKTKSLAYVIEHVKKRSSVWIKQTEDGAGNFSWQTGYGAFSVSASGLDAVTRYISKQKEHHLKMTFKEEMEWLFKKYGHTDYDPDRFWD